MDEWAPNPAALYGFFNDTNEKYSYFVTIRTSFFTPASQANTQLRVPRCRQPMYFLPRQHNHVPTIQFQANDSHNPHTTCEAPAGKDAVRAVETTIGKGKQQLRDIPQSITVVTEKLIDDRNLDTLKDVLHNTAGVTFQAAEGGEEDIRLRGFSLAATGDIFCRRHARPRLLRTRHLQ